MALRSDTKNALRNALGLNAAAEVIADLAVPSGLTASAAEVNARCDGQPASVAFSAAAGSSNVCEVTVTVLDGDGSAITKPTPIIVQLSDASSGYGLTATTASGAVAAKASGGTDLSALVAKKAILAQTKADGTYILSITDTAKTGFYPVVMISGLKAFVGSQLVTGNYG